MGWQKTKNKKNPVWCLGDSGNTIPQGSGCLLYSGVQIPWWHFRTIKGMDTRYKLYRCGNDKGTAGVGVFVAEEWIEKVFEVQRLSDRIIFVKLIVGQHMVTFLSVYALQSGLSYEVKYLFLDQLQAVTARILIPCGNWKGHVGHAGTGYRGSAFWSRLTKLIYWIYSM